MKKKKVLFSETVFHRIGPRVSQDRTFSKNQRSYSKETPCIRAIQGQTGEDVITPELTGHVAISFKWKGIPVSPRMLTLFELNLRCRTHRWWEGTQRRASNCSSLHQMAGETSPRKVHCKSKWKHSQDAVYLIHLAKAQEKGLHLGQTRSRAVVVYDSVLADCIEKSVCKGGERTLYQRLHASAGSEDNPQGCHPLKAAAATAQAGHIEEDRETCSRAEPRHLQQRQQREHRETCFGG